MEIFELRYFLAVARFENIHRASEHSNVSPASLSKAVARLEDELQVRLFKRVGRRIELTDHGKVLQRKAAAIVRLEEDARIEVGGHEGRIQVVMAAPEILLARFGLQLSAEIMKRFPCSSFEYVASEDGEALDAVARGDAQLGITTGDVPASLGLTARVLGEAKFHTFVGQGHPLYSRAAGKKPVPVDEVLRFPFVSPTHPLLGKVGIRQSLDGWRDDQFPRNVAYRTSSLKTLEEFVVQGQAIAYLPDYFSTHPKLRILTITGCPYQCVQTVRLVAKDPRETGWLQRLF